MLPIKVMVPESIAVSEHSPFICRCSREPCLSSWTLCQAKPDLHQRLRTLRQHAICHLPGGDYCHATYRRAVSGTIPDS